MTVPSVLIVDDNDADRYLLRRDLETISYQGHIFEADDGQSAYDFLIDYDAKKTEHGDLFPPIIIFLDINMPIMNGFMFLEKLEQLKADDVRYKSIVVMMFTSSEQIDDMERAKNYNFVSKFLIKGEYEPELLKHLIEEII